MAIRPFTTRKLPFAGRLSLTLVLAILGGGYISSFLFMVDHHQNRDGREGLSKVDIEGIYSGTVRPPIFADLLRDGHPTEHDSEAALDETDREVLLEWLTGENIAANWSNIDFGDGYGSPQEIVGMACASCHGAAAPAERRAEPELDDWSDYQEIALEKEIKSNEVSVLLATTHTHAIGMGTVTLLMVLLGHATRLRAWVVALASIAASAGLLLDLISWWLARLSSIWTSGIILGGAAHAIGMALLFLFVFIDLWMPMGTTEDD